MRSRHLAALSFTLALREPLSLGDPHRISITDRLNCARETAGDVRRQVPIPVAADPSGRPVVRGTSVMGVLRKHLSLYELDPAPFLPLQSIDSGGKRTTWTRNATLADLLCGSEPEELEGRGARALRPSPLRLVSSELAAQVPDTPARTRTAISRCTGAGVATKVFTRQHLEDARIRVILQVDLAMLERQLQVLATQTPGGRPATWSALAVVDDLVSVTHGWQPLLGGMVGTGMGKADVEDLTWGLADPLPVPMLLTAASTVDLMTSLARQPGSVQALNTCRRRAADTWLLQVDLQAADPLLVAPVTNGQATNAQKTQAFVAGASWRGVLRSRCEFILRSIGHPACASSDSTCGECLTCTLFGWAPTRPSGGDGAQGLIRFRDSPIAGHHIPDFTHAPIDRYTGGASNQRLYSRTSFAPGATTTLVIEQLDPTRPVPRWGQQLLQLAIRDLADGYVGIGNSSTRGYGTLTLRPGQALEPVEPGWAASLPVSPQPVGRS